ncbi:bifunctional transcriptional activator/DNA repair enzyme AdaA [Pseudochryseolinea flava]|uniref:Methylated-DNA--protein-cysteine methyltransferase n=1 Tax=Pseudochryseolinea flava TaxID=2059302 RepID=A0A364Y751_9BACT|nr:methylated-DNA--[protein]-cysteine S-methyltransferase [Pseudochryseolinea flava]RAW02891.1 XRE family transcriptional regulator [Pseudochryseolinea flava]
MTTLTFQQKYDAMYRKDASFDGVFITAVKTTGVFCRPVCTARKPKPENVVFYDTTEEAILHGFRPCQVCKPMLQPDQMPDHIKALVDEIVANPELRLKDGDLKLRNIEPSQLRRWFKKNHNISFQSFQRQLRINNAFTKLHSGESVTASAYDAGYNSLSGFNESFKSIFGEAPTSAKEKSIINIARFTTKLGPMYACATQSGICLLEFTNRRMLEREFNDLKRLLNAVILPGKNIYLAQVEREITEYFNGVRKEFTVSLHTPGTEFQKSVWDTLRRVPYGETRSYKTLASSMNNPNAVRAVASANGFNRVAIIVPCHRIIGENGNLTGYGGGLPRKKWLIDFEREKNQ